MLQQYTMAELPDKELIECPRQPGRLRISIDALRRSSPPRQRKVDRARKISAPTRTMPTHEESSANDASPVHVEAM